MAMEAYPHDVICKPHPRSFYRTDVAIKMFNNSIVPMEIVYATIGDLDRRILIGNLSTALFTPKMLFNIEPYVISIHKLISLNYSVLEPIYVKFASVYSDKDKIYAPDSFEQFMHYMKQIAKAIEIG